MALIGQRDFTLIDIIGGAHVELGNLRLRNAQLDAVLACIVVLPMMSTMALRRPLRSRLMERIAFTVSSPLLLLVELMSHWVIHRVEKRGRPLDLRAPNWYLLSID